jgi:chromosome segregation ATPase
LLLLIRTVTLLVSQSSKSNASNDLQELLQKQAELEDDKQKLTREKDELQQELSKLKDHLLENERDSSRIKSSLAALEGEAGGQTKGEVLQLQKSIREQTSEVKLKEAEIQKLKDLVRKQDQKLKEGKAKLAKAEASADQSIRDENSELSKKLQTAKVHAFVSCD